MRTSLLLCSLLLFSACDYTDEPEPEPQGPEPQTPEFSTNQERYILLPGDESVNAHITATYANATARTFYLARCGTAGPAPILDKREGDDWQGAYGGICPDILGPPIVIEPGASFTHTFTVEAWTRYNTVPSLDQLDPPGQYRLRLQLYKAWPPRDADLLPLEQRVSSPFDLMIAF